VLYSSCRTRSGIAIPFVLAWILGFGLLSLLQPASSARAQSVDQMWVVLRWLDAEQRGDVDGALAQFADNAVFIGSRATGNCSTHAPCTDLTGIRQQIEGNIAQHNCYAFRSLQVSGGVVTGIREIPSDASRANGIDRVVQSFIAVVSDGKITFFAGALDTSDPQTARNAAINAGTQPAGTPLPAPGEACPSLL